MRSVEEMKASGICHEMWAIAQGNGSIDEVVSAMELVLAEWIKGDANESA